MTFPRFYAGIGSRRTPPGVQQYMARLATELGERGWTLRSGGAAGADSAFYSGASRAEAPYEVYLPWSGFADFEGQVALHEPALEAMRVAAEVHPAWARLPQGARKCVARNVHQVLGRAPLSAPVPSAFVVCWTPDGAETWGECTALTGGTGTAVRVADRRASPPVPVWNLQRRSATGVRELVAALEELAR